MFWWVGRGIGKLLLGNGLLMVEIRVGVGAAVIVIGLRVGRRWGGEGGGSVVKR